MSLCKHLRIYYESTNTLPEMQADCNDQSCSCKDCSDDCADCGKSHNNHCISTITTLLNDDDNNEDSSRFSDSEDEAPADSDDQLMDKFENGAESLGMTAGEAQVILGAECIELDEFLSEEPVDPSTED